MSDKGQQQTFYKATRVDQTDFRTGTILYEPGKRVRPHPADRRRICGPGYLHAADVPTETLLGGEWPCRLFEVTGKPVVGFDSQHPHKGGFKQLTVERELPAHEVFGPQGAELVEFFGAVRALDYEQAKRLHAAWNAACSAARIAAWNAARFAARNAAWNAAWAAACSAAWDAALDAARDAALAILTRDLIGSGDYTQEHHDLLYAPWKEVVERAKETP